MSATNRHGAERVEDDFYPTPDWLTEAVIPVLERHKVLTNPYWRKKDDYNRVFEPACGDLAMVNVLQKYYNRVDYSDIVEPYNQDFLKTEPKPIYDIIITNPPFSLAQEFVDRAMLWRKSHLSIVAMVLRLNFAGAIKRQEWFQTFEPCVYVSSKRPSFGKNKEGKKGTDNSEYAWFIWDQRKNPATFGHLDLDLDAIAKAEKEKNRQKRLALKMKNAKIAA